ncbi:MULTISPECIES: AAA family ATPase [Actibacterium]|uniref:5-methylcytosine-specific restriction protein B n=1 Tax=Actibacterium naphthalenivorans TaxID=1614693 RepID=A0A840CGD8_9RHOB|nr:MULTISPECIES: AAA family ATPase [Actibacterium]MBB4021876.1 5-methylcytosine-specific restriction protein B [Actibacterium naphthalenivorans]
MRYEAEFKAWLEEKGQSLQTVSSRISSAKRVEQYLGDLDELFSTQTKEKVLEKFAYSTEDEREGRPNPSPVPINGVLRTGLASIRQALELYHSFLANRRNMPDKSAHQTLVDRLSRKEIEGAMEECRKLGEKVFLQRRGFATPKVRVSGYGDLQTYPAKAIVAAAVAHLPENSVLTAKEFFNGFGEAQAFSKLEELGYEILRPSETQDKGTLTREVIEAAMDAFDLRETAEFETVFSAFKEPTKYWVRSTKPREDRKYPTKPIVGFLSQKTSSTLNGGWSQPSDAAAKLHEAGYVIVDKNDVPLPLPDEYLHLMRGADRARFVALNYFIEPAREAGQSSVTIRAGDLHDLCGLEKNWANVCQALEGEKFQSLAQVAAPKIEGPARSTTTMFTFELGPKDFIKGEHMPHSANTAAENLILFGPPGTGKTYRTAAEAVRLCGEKVPEDRDDLMAVYQGLLAAGRIEFVTFHQSMAYEEFVEGRQPMTGADDSEDTSSAGFRLETVPGIFRRIAKRAETSRGHASDEETIRVEGRQVFKMSIGEANNPEDAHLFEEAIKGGYALLGFEDIDWSDDKFANREAIIEACKAQGHHKTNVDARSGMVQMPFIFRNWVRDGDIVIVSKGNGLFRAIGVFSGGYEFAPRPEGDYAHRRAVRWLWIDREGVPVGEIYSRKFSQKSIYALYDAELNVPALERYMNSQQNEGPSDPEPFVLIIDEINRANISKVFGELITLLESDKRLGQANQLKVRLPYSGDEFGVPSNLHIVGTMNTADRSIALLDTALRRRFTFREILPNPAVLKEAAARTGIDLPTLLTIINERIEYLYDRDHQIGHAYFTGCDTRANVDEVMRHKVIPLLAEYFFEDWGKIAAVLGDLDTHDGPIEGGFLNRSVLKAPPGLDNGEAMPRFRWDVREDSFNYARLLGS